MFEYSCFLHPHKKGSSLDQLCPECGEEFGFPLKKHPGTVNGKTVIKGISRGYYGAVLLTQHPRLPRHCAVKVIPKATHELAEEEGYGSSLEAEIAIHDELSETGLVAGLEDHGEEILTFGTYDIPCHWIEMQYVDGPTIEDKKKAPPDKPREIAQIALDLLDFVNECGKRKVFHNDLHGDNIKVVSLSEKKARRGAIDPFVAVRVLDMGSAAGRTKSGPSRLGDAHWVASHILDLVNAYERRSKILDQTDARLIANLRKVAELAFATDTARRPSPEDFRSLITSAYIYGVHPWDQPVWLPAVDHHYNAQTMPPHFAPVLLHDPEGKWASQITRPGPQLLTGMRGCGKTMLMHSLEWVARAHPRKEESQDQMLDRLRADTFLGLFVSCSSLLRGPRPKSVELSVQRLFLAFAREVVLNADICDLRHIGTVNFEVLDRLSSLIKRVAPWFEAPGITTDPFAVERAISHAMQNPPGEGNGSLDFSPRNVFDELVRCARDLVDLWSNKYVLFLLDDVSTRYLPQQNINYVLSHLCLQSPEFGCVVSTETQTLALNTPGGESARFGRDYEVFDLGAEVLKELKASGPPFIEEILRRRSEVTTAASGLPASDVLGRQDLSQVARSIKNQPAKTPVYWGIDVLSGMCVGDIGEVLQLFNRMLTRSTGVMPIPKDAQHDVIIDEAENRLFSLAGRDEWLYSHAVAFAQASHTRLKRSSDARLRQYCEVFVKIDPKDAPEVFPKMIKLVDAGVFVLTGGTPRSKQRKGSPSVMFKLGYHKLLGTTNRIPLSWRDRFEPSGDKLVSWMRKPSAALLLSDDDATDGMAVEESQHSDQGSDKLSGSVGQYVLPGCFPTVACAKSGLSSGELRTLYHVETTTASLISETRVDWNDKHIVGALGFEERSVGAWRNLFQVGTPSSATLLGYDDPGLTDEIIDIVKSHQVPTFRTERGSDVSTLEQACAFVSRYSPGTVVIDTTSLTKHLIYLLVLASLLEHEEAWILHTCAQSYFPRDNDVRTIVNLYDAKDYLKTFRRLSSVVRGEVGPFSIKSIGTPRVDPARPSLMVAFASLKHDRVEKILSAVPVERVVAMVPLDTAGPDSPRSKASRIVANYLAQTYNGSVCEVGSLDHDETYRLLRVIYAHEVLEEGYNFEIALTGKKMQIVGVAMMAATILPAAVYYSSPASYDRDKFTKGTGLTRVCHLSRVETVPPQ